MRTASQKNQMISTQHNKADITEVSLLGDFIELSINQVTF